MRCVFCRAYRSKPGHRLLSAGCTLLSTVRAQSALRAGAVAHGHYYSTRRARVCQGGFTNFSQKNGGEGGVCLPLPSPFFLPPIPPTPFPGGEGGELRLFHARGFAPCIPGIKPLAALIVPAKQVPGGGACLVCRLPTLPLACFSAPIPPTPFPGGEGGESKFSYARGFAPCIPATEPVRHSQSLPSRYPAGACPVGRLPILPLVYFSAPNPPAPIPAGRGRFLVYFAGGFAPGTPAFNRLRHLQSLPSRYPEGACPRRSGARRKARKRTQVPFPGNNKKSRKVLGGPGDSFKSPPAYLCRQRGINPVCGV